MNKISKSQLFNLGVAVATIIGMVLTSKAQDAEIKELKEEIKAEMKLERNN